jgi:hypothetical protein
LTIWLLLVVAQVVNQTVVVVAEQVVTEPQQGCLYLLKGIQLLLEQVALQIQIG